MTSPRLIGASCGGVSSLCSHAVVPSHGGVSHPTMPSVGVPCGTDSIVPRSPSVGLSRGAVSVPHASPVAPPSRAMSRSCPTSPPTQGSNASGFAVAHARVASHRPLSTLFLTNSAPTSSPLPSPNIKAIHVPDISLSMPHPRLSKRFRRYHLRLQLAVPHWLRLRQLQFLARRSLQLPHLLIRHPRRLYSLTKPLARAPPQTTQYSRHDLCLLLSTYRPHLYCHRPRRQALRFPSSHTQP